MPSSHFNFESYPSATPFLAKMRTKLEANEARNGLMLGLALRVEQDPRAYGDEAPYFATVENGIGVVTAALMTPPRGLILYCVNDEAGSYEAEALQAIAHNLRADNWHLPTVHGPSEIAVRFAEIWSEVASVNHEVMMAQRAFELREVNHPTESAGQLRKATEADQDIAVEFISAFEVEAFPNQSTAEQLQKLARQKIADGHLFLWDDEKPVCLVGLSRPTARGISIGPVYTPPNQRGRGYASSAVARLSQEQLDSGKEFCTLFTDLANPTSNSIYQKLGYQPIGDFKVVRFSEVG